MKELREAVVVEAVRTPTGRSGWKGMEKKGAFSDVSAQDLIAMSNGELNAVSAFMQGKIKISGDMSLAMRLQSILA